MGMFTANTVTGDFSIMAPSSYKIENGEIAYAVDPLAIGGNMYEALKTLSGIGSDNDLTFVGKIPCIRFEGFTVSG